MDNFGFREEKQNISCWTFWKMNFPFTNIKICGKFSTEMVISSWYFYISNFCRFWKVEKWCPVPLVKMIVSIFGRMLIWIQLLSLISFRLSNRVSSNPLWCIQAVRSETLIISLFFPVTNSGRMESAMFLMSSSEWKHTRLPLIG